MLLYHIWTRGIVCACAMNGPNVAEFRTNDQVAEAMGAEPELLPLLPDLFADFTALGCWPEEMVVLLREHADLPPRARVVDLGCGKGAAAIAIAAELGHEVLGVDLFEPFLVEGRRAATDTGVDHLVSFQQGDLRGVAGAHEPFDVAVFAAVGAGIFCNFAGCVGALRQCVRPGGYMLICDGFLVRESAKVPPGYEYYRAREETRRQLGVHGDVLVAETLIPAEKLESEEDLGRLRTAVDRLLEAIPERRQELEEFMDSQRGEVEFIENETREAVWLLRRF